MLQCEFLTLLISNSHTLSFMLCDIITYPPPPPPHTTTTSAPPARVSLAPNTSIPAHIELSVLDGTTISLENPEALVDAAANNPEIAASVEASLAALAAQVRDMQARLALVKAAGAATSVGAGAGVGMGAGASVTPVMMIAPPSLLPLTVLPVLAAPLHHVMSAPGSAVKTSAGVGPRPARAARTALRGGPLSRTAPAGGLGL
jgi:hypothetical protein